MSVAISNDPRHYGRRNTSRIPRNPPEYTCSAVLLDRKFIASSGPPPPVEARRLAQTLNTLNHSSRAFNLCVYRDRLFFRSHSRGSELPDIYFDDIIQLEIIPSKRNLLFILCGRRGIGSYYFFKLSDDFVVEKIKDLVRRVNPDLIFPNDYYDYPKNYHRRFDDHSSSKLNDSECGTDRTSRKCPASPSMSSTNTCTCSSFTPYRQNSYIRWEGYRRNRNRISSRQPGSRGAQKRQTTVRVYQSPSRYHSESSRGNNKEGGRYERSPVMGKTDHFFVIEDDQIHSRSATRPNSKYAKDKPYQKKSQRTKSRPFVPETSTESNYHRTGQMNLNYDEPNTCKSTFDLANEVQVDGHSYPSNGYKGGNTDDYDWESVDSWDLFDGKSMNQFGGANVSVPGTGAVHSRDLQHNTDDLSYSSEDSLYLEKEQELASHFPNRKTHCLPELQQKFHRFNLN